MNAVFRSKVDGGFGWIALATPCVALVVLFTVQPGNRLVWIPVGGMALTAIVVCWTFLSTYYELQGDQLVTHCGPFTWRIALAEISEVRESQSLRSGPALSMDRLEIVYRDGKVLPISPADKTGFVAALLRRAPHVRA